MLHVPGAQSQFEPPVGEQIDRGRVASEQHGMAEVVVDHENVCRLAGENQRREVLHGIVGELGIERRVDAKREGDDQQRVAIGGRLRDRIGPDQRAAAGTVLDHRGDAPVILEFLRHDAAERVVEAARRVGHHDADRLVGELSAGR